MMRCRKCGRDARLNTDRQEHRALVELMRYLRLDPGDLSFDREVKLLERWEHPGLEAPIRLHTYDYDPSIDEYLGERIIEVPWNGHMQGASYDTDGLKTHRLPTSDLSVRLEEVPGWRTFEHLEHPGVAGKLKALDKRYGVEEARLNGKEIRNIGEWIKRGPYQPQRMDADVGEVEVTTKIQGISSPLSMERPYEEAKQHIEELKREDVVLEWAKINGEIVFD